MEIADRDIMDAPIGAGPTYPHGFPVKGNVTRKAS